MNPAIVNDMTEVDAEVYIRDEETTTCKEALL